MVTLLVGPALVVSLLVSLFAGKMALQLILGTLDRGGEPVRIRSEGQER